MAKIDVKAVSGAWYRKTGSGMGATLNTSAAIDAYILSDRGTWLNFKNRGDLVVAVVRDSRLFNPCGIMLINPKKVPNVKAKKGPALIDWMISKEGQQTIAS